MNNLNTNSNYTLNNDAQNYINFFISSSSDFVKRLARQKNAPSYDIVLKKITLIGQSLSQIEQGVNLGKRAIKILKKEIKSSEKRMAKIIASAQRQARKAIAKEHRKNLSKFIDKMTQPG